MNRPNRTYLIQFDNRSKRFPVAVTTMSGRCVAYFRTVHDAEQFCATHKEWP